MNELMTLIDLCPGIRLPQNEPEIFSDLALAEYYLYKLCEQYDWYTHGVSAPYMVYRYARNVMKSRWSEAEPVIATSPGWAYYYACDVMNTRWPEAEAIIATDRDYREWYNSSFGTNLTPPRNKIMARLAKLLCMN